MQKIKTEKKAKLDDAKKTRVQTSAQVSIKVLTDAFARLQDLMTRTDGAITKVEAGGVVATDARARLSEAQALSATAQVKIALLDTDLAAALASTTPSAAFETFRTDATAARDGIKAAHGKVVDAIVALKLLVPVSATSTSADVNVSASTSVER